MAVPQLNPVRWKLSEYERNEYVANAELGTTVEDIMDPSYWAHVASKLKPYDRIEVRVDDGSWMAEVMVREAGRNWARMHLLHHFKLETTDVSQTQVAKLDKFYVKFMGPQHKWSVLRTSDNALMFKEMGSRAEAQRRLEEHEASLG